MCELGCDESGVVISAFPVSLFNFIWVGRFLAEWFCFLV